MELVYLWVEKTERNIDNEEFNFSPKFTIHFEEKLENGNLTKDSILNIDYNNSDNIFKKNINITAIVGKNGSGKTALLNQIFHNVNEQNDVDNRRNFIQCYFDAEKDVLFIDTVTYFKNSKFNINSNIKIGFIDDKVFKEENFFYHYKNDLDYPISYNSFGAYNEKVIKYSEPNKIENKIINIEIEEEKNLKKIINLIDNEYTKHIDENRFFVPTKIFINKRNEVFLGKTRQYDMKYIEIKNNFIGKNKCKELILLENILYLINLKKEKESSLIMEKVSLPSFDLNSLKIEDEIQTFVHNFLNKFEYDIDSVRNRITHNHNIDNYSESLTINEFEKILKLFEEIDSVIEILKDDFTQEHYYPKIELLNEENVRLIKNLPRFLLIDILDSTGKEYSQLSTGEKSLLNIIYSITNIIDIRVQSGLTKNMYLLLDEIESFLHPDWQRRIINYIYNFIKKYEINIHIILSSHSPFILSDLPKENVIFLKNGIQDKTVDMKTFGANIHTLLSHGFFMDGGLMGEFAKEKIQSIIKYYEEIIEKDLMKDENKQLREEEKEKYQKNKQKNFWNIQLIIGDDYLKQVIKNHLIEIEKIVLGQDESKNEEIKRLQAQIDLLENS